MESGEEGLKRPPKYIYIHIFPSAFPPLSFPCWGRFEPKIFLTRPPSPHPSPRLFFKEGRLRVKVWPTSYRSYVSTQHLVFPFFLDTCIPNGSVKIGWGAGRGVNSERQQIKIPNRGSGAFVVVVVTFSLGFCTNWGWGLGNSAIEISHDVYAFILDLHSYMDGGGEGLVGSVGVSIMIQALESFVCGIWSCFMIPCACY